MTAQDAVALEAEQEILPVRLHGLEAAPVEPLGDACRPRAGMHSLD